MPFLTLQTLAIEQPICRQNAIFLGDAPLKMTQANPAYAMQPEQQLPTFFTATDAAA